MLRTLIAYVSVSHANTAKVAHAIGEVLSADLLEPESVDPAQVSTYDVLGVGSGVYGGTAHPRLRSFVQHLPPGDGMAAFTFSSSGFGRSQSRPWEASVDDLLRGRGYQVLGAFACRGYDTWLPLRRSAACTRATRTSRPRSRPRVRPAPGLAGGPRRPAQLREHHAGLTGVDRRPAANTLII